MRFITKLIENRNLLKNLILRDLKYRYVGSVGGFLWSIVHPLVMLVSYTFVYMVFKQTLTDAHGTDSFPIFLFCGLLPWILFADTVTRSCGVILENAQLITKTVIPAEILPISITLSNLVHHAIGLALLLGILLAFETIPASAVGILLYLPILLVFAQGLGWIVAGLQVFLRDTAQALQILMLLWFWFTPIFYPLELVPPEYRLLISLNPMTPLISGYRNSLLGLPQPAPVEIATAALVSAAVFMIGGLIFRQTKPVFADVL